MFLLLTTAPLKSPSTTGLTTHSQLGGVCYIIYLYIEKNKEKKNRKKGIRRNKTKGIERKRKRKRWKTEDDGVFVAADNEW